MAAAIINGRRVDLPSATSDDEIREMGGIKSGRTLLKRNKYGNFVIPRKSQVSVKDGDTFVDAPARIKG
jgi:hypothetical protein